MCLLIAEIIMLVGGLVALVTGKLKLSNALQLEGTPARIAGAILMAPLPLALAIGFMIGLLIGMGALPESALGLSTVIEIALVLGALVAAYFYGRSARSAQPPAGPGGTHMPTG
jgi:hypothetical protein